MKHAIRAIAVAAIALGAPAPSAARDVEVGTVDWRRDFDAVLAESARTGMPVFAFFQEVPGCEGCRSFGADVMSHRPIVDAVEREFLPVLIYNNRGGKDAEIVARFDEPSWNYQVIRFLDGSGADLIPRQDRVWTRDALAARMIRALEAAGRPAPRYLQATARELDPVLLESVAFAQPCFWSGEVALGRIPGVITTEAGWIAGREVTLVHYQPSLVTLDALVDRAIEADVAETVYLEHASERARVGRERSIATGVLDDSYRRAKASDQQRQIGRTAFAALDLSPMQRTKVNAFVTVDMARALSWLTPTQRVELSRLDTQRGTR